MIITIRMMIISRRFPFHFQSLTLACNFSWFHAFRRNSVFFANMMLNLFAGWNGGGEKYENDTENKIELLKKKRDARFRDDGSSCFGHNSTVSHFTSKRGKHTESKLLLLLDWMPWGGLLDFANLCHTVVSKTWRGPPFDDTPTSTTDC